MSRKRQLDLFGNLGGHSAIMENIQDTSLVAEAQRRYLNYALSVITSRARNRTSLRCDHIGSRRRAQQMDA